MRSFKMSAGEGLYIVEAVVVLCGKDLNICFAGGDTFHIGACALAVPRPSLSDATAISSSASVLCVTGHKEDELARSAALKLSARFNTRVSVSCGLHIDNATSGDIELLFANYQRVLTDIEQELMNVY